MTEAVQIATLVDPSLKHLVAADLSTEDMKKLLMEHTNQVISKTTAASNFTCTKSSTSGRSSTDNSATSVEVPPSQPQPRQSAESQPSKKRKLLQKFNQTESAGTSIDTEIICNYINS